MFGTKSSLPSMTIFKIIFTFKIIYIILKLSFPYMSKYKNQSSVCVLMNFSFALFLQLYFASYSTMLSLLVSTFRNNAITTVFSICFWKYCSRSKYRPTDRVGEVATMSGCDITSTDNIEFCNGVTLQWLCSF